MRGTMVAVVAAAVALPTAGAGQVFGPAALPVAAPIAPRADAAVDADLIAPPPPGYGQVVFYRRGDFLGRAISCAVREGGTLLTHLPPGRFGVVNVPAGVHMFEVSSEASDVMRVDVRAGQSYYGVCAVQVGFFAGRPQLTLVGRETFLAIAPLLKPVKGTVLAAVPAAAPAAAAAVPVATPAEVVVQEPGRPPVPDRGIPANSAYVAPPAEIFVKTLPPR